MPVSMSGVMLVVEDGAKRRAHLQSAGEGLAARRRVAGHAIAGARQILAAGGGACTCLGLGLGLRTRHQDQATKSAAASCSHVMGRSLEWCGHD